jgi:hypothetical protein
LDRGHGVVDVIDYDLHGMVGVRVLDATGADARVVDRQLGGMRGSLHREPDLVVRFVDELTSDVPPILLGLEDAAFTADRLRLAAPTPRGLRRTAVSFGGADRPSILECERGIRSVPSLIPLVNLHAGAHGFLALHASAFVYRGVGTLVTGWAKGGKTETLLGFMARGAQYLGDEWVYLDPRGGEMYGVPVPIRLWQWHMAQLPEYRRRVPGRDRARIAAFAAARRATRGALPMLNRIGIGANAAVRAHGVLARLLSTKRAPRQLFGAGACVTHGRVDKLLLVMSHESSEITVVPTSGANIAERMLASLQYERIGLLETYIKHRFAFPNARSNLVENAEATEKALLGAALATHDAYEVRHPYPFEIGRLVDLIEPILSAP